jgi:5-amino-6-(5-phosphoribosylamino)uracil reductase
MNRNLRPFLFTNLAISIDGKIADTLAPSKPLGTVYDRKQMQVLRKKADAILVGAGTIRAFPFCYKVKGASKQPVNVVLTRSGNLDSSLKFWEDSKVIRFVFTTREGYLKAREGAKERAFVIEADDGRGGVDPNLVIERLSRSGIRNILVEGGGEIIELFASQNLLDELNITLTPWLLGGLQNPNLMGGSQSPAIWSDWKLVQAKKVKHEVYLKYRKGKSGTSRKNRSR